MTEKKDKDPIVYALSRTSRCYNCDSKLIVNEIVTFKDNEDEREVLCCKCAGLNELELLPGGNAKVTRLAKKYSKQRYVVMKWSELWKCYERQGLLLEKQAIAQARQEAN